VSYDMNFTKVKIKNLILLGTLMAILLCTSCVYNYQSYTIAPEPDETGDSYAQDTLWTWGLNIDYTNMTFPGNKLGTPVHIKGINEIKAIAAGAYSMILKNEGTVWERRGSTTEYLTLKQVAGLDKIIAIASGIDDHRLALKSDGTVWVWGGNGWGQTGDGTKGTTRKPSQAIGLPNVVAIAAGDQNSAALSANGTVWEWGRKYRNDSSFDRGSAASIPEQVPGLEKATAIATGASHKLALKSDGTVWAWGKNYSGELGSGSDKGSGIPIRVIGLTEVIAIASGEFHNLALKSDGTVWFWGDLFFPNEGRYGKHEARRVPEQVSGLNQIVAIAAGDYHNLALRSDGTVWAWGDNHNAQLGDGTTVSRMTPALVRKLTGVRAITCGTLYNMALK
jgi:alpha-tubulin suppressor-like RCC1 family protein